MATFNCPVCKSDHSIPESSQSDVRIRRRGGAFSGDTLHFFDCATCATPLEVWADGTVLDFTPQPEPEPAPELEPVLELEPVFER